jgi:hypothetical protein
VTASEKAEWLKCSESPLYFIDTFCQIYDATDRVWVPFKLWAAQAQVIRAILKNKLVILLKARQVGMSWLVLAFALWLALFRPAATILVFSKRDDEAIYLLGLERLRGMYQRLPKHLQAKDVLSSNDHEWTLSNGSVFRAFPTSGGDSYTATLAIVDEADLAPDLNRLMNAVKPTIDGGGWMILLSRVDKTKPLSEFKRIYRAAKERVNGWKSIFLPWHVRPGRDAEWYEAQTRDIESRTGALDDLYQQYPATDAEALAPATKDKRIPYEFLLRCYHEVALFIGERAPKVAGLPAIEGLIVYRLPEAGKKYVIGADPAEGNPTSDDSSLNVLERASGEQVAKLKGKFQPEVFAAQIDAIGMWFNKANVLPERNNHGHAVILWLKLHSKLKVLKASDDKPGWNTTALSKSLMYDNTVEVLREGETMVHDFETLTQLSTIEGNSLSAPEGMHDDDATSYALALQARLLKAPEPGIR